MVFLTNHVINLIIGNVVKTPNWVEWFTCWQAVIQPDLVIWNTLRQFYRGDMNDSDTVVRVYAAMRQFFPGACHLVVAHDRKASADGEHDHDEAFAGSNAWRQLANVALHLRPTNDSEGALTLDYTKTQVSEKVPPLRLWLAPDGTQLSLSQGPTRTQLVMTLWEQAPSEGDKATWVGQRMGVSRATVNRLREHG